MEPIWYKSYDPDVPRSLEYPQEPLPILLKKNAEKYSNNTATEFFGAMLTYSSLWKQVQSFAKSELSLELKLPSCFPIARKRSLVFMLFCGWAAWR